MFDVPFFILSDTIVVMDAKITELEKKQLEQEAMITSLKESRSTKSKKSALFKYLNKSKATSGLKSCVKMKSVSLKAVTGHKENQSSKSTIKKLALKFNNVNKTHNF